MYKILERNKMELEDNLYPGDIILLWRINFDTYTNETINPRYFKEVYGINAEESLLKLIEKDYAFEESAFDSLDHVRVEIIRDLLKKKGIKNLSKLKKEELIIKLYENFSEEELSSCFYVRGYKLTEKGKNILEKYSNVVDKHPKKKIK